MRKIHTLLTALLAATFLMTTGAHAGNTLIPRTGMKPIPHPTLANLPGANTANTKQAVPYTPELIPAGQAVPGTPAKLTRLPEPSANAIQGMAKVDADINWTGWTEFGKTSFPDGFFNSVSTTLPYNGDTWPTWQEPFTVMRRHNTDNPDQVQFRFDNIFNSVNITISWDAQSKALFMEQQTTGIQQAEYDKFYNGYTEYHFGSIFNAATACGYFFPASGTFQFFGLFLYASPDMGYGLGGCTMTLDGHQPIDFTVTGDEYYRNNQFYPASVTKATFTVSHSSQVKSYRVATGSLTISILNDLTSANPSGDTPYTDFTSPTFDIEIGYDTRYTATIIPLGEDGSTIAPHKSVILYSNRQQPYEWIPLGKATMTDIVGLCGVPDELLFDENGTFISSPQTRQVDIDMRNDNPNIFRIHNPFGKDYPLYEHLTPTGDDDFYIIIDATDPSRTIVTQTLCGFNNNGRPAEMNMLTQVTDDDKSIYDSLMSGYWGKFADKRIVFPTSSVLAGNSHIPIWDVPDLELLLPGYIDYTLTWENNGAPDNDNCYTITTSANVTSVDCALISREQWNQNKNYPERLYAMVTDRAEGLVIKNYPVTDSRVTVPAEELTGEDYTYTGYRLVAVPRDAEGTAHAGTVSDKEFMLIDKSWSAWELVDFATVTFTQFYSATIDLPLFMRQSTGNPNMMQYGLPNPNGYSADNNFTPVTEDDLFYIIDFDKTNTIIVDGVECTRVTLPEINTGIDTGGYRSMLSDVYSWLQNIVAPDQSAETIFDFMEQQNLGHSYYNPERGRFFINVAHYPNDMPGYAFSDGYEYIQLPGYKDYSIKFTQLKNTTDETGTEHAVISATKSNDVEYYAIDCLPGALDDAAIASAVENIKNDTDAQLISDESTTLSFPLGSAYGTYTVVAVGYNAGEAVYTTSFQFDYSEYPWESIGFCKYTDGIIYLLFQFTDGSFLGGETWDVEVEKSLKEDGLYRLVDPYATWPFNNTVDLSIDGVQYIYFNAARNDGVYLIDSPIGLNFSEIGLPGDLSIQSNVYNFLQNGDTLEQCIQEGWCGTNNNGIITFPATTIILCVAGEQSWTTNLNETALEARYNQGQDFKPGPYYGDGYLTIDMHNLIPTAIEQVGNDTIEDDAPAEFFNLQGIRVTNPSGGIFIERRGNNVSKRYIP